MSNSPFSRYTWNWYCYYYFTSLYGEEKMGTTSRKVHNLWHLSTSCWVLVSHPLQIWSRCSLLFSRGSSLWILKAQGREKMFHSFGVKSMSCIHCTTVFKMNSYGAALIFLGIKSIHVNQSFAPVLCCVEQSNRSMSTTITQSLNVWFTWSRASNISHIMLFSVFKSSILRWCFFFFLQISQIRANSGLPKH